MVLFGASALLLGACLRACLRVSVCVPHAPIMLYVCVCVYYMYKAATNIFSWVPARCVPACVCPCPPSPPFDMYIQGSDQNIQLGLEPFVLPSL